jgi:deoxyribonuclease V
VDVHYPDAGGACAGLVVASDERFTDVVEECIVWLSTVDAYQPGRFYLRELPAITAVLATTTSAHVHMQIGLPVIGVAKTAFRTATHAVTIHRGNDAIRPLFITAVGLPVDQAAALVTAMAGPHRIPDALRHVDTLARQGSHK